MTAPLAFPNVRAAIVARTGEATPVFAAFLRGLYERSGGSRGAGAIEIIDGWAPNFDGLLIVGTVAFSAQAVRVNDSVLWRAQITPIGGATTANDGTALLTNLPYPARPGAWCDVSDFVVSSYGRRRVSGRTALLAPWTATPSAIVVSGSYEAA